MCANRAESALFGSGSARLGEDGTLYQGASRLYALDAATGVKKWQLYGGDALFESTPALGEDGSLYIGCDDTNFYAVNMRSREVRWKYKTGGPIRSSPALSGDGKIYVGSEDHQLYALARKDGSKLWTFATEHGVASSPVIGNNGLVYCQNWGHVYAIHTKDGKLSWKYQVADDLYSKSTPAIGSYGNIYLAFVLKGKTKDYAATIIALDALSGERRWQRDLPAYVYASPAIGSNGYVYIGCGDGKLYALEEKSGNYKWSFKAAGRIQGSPVPSH